MFTGEVCLKIVKFRAERIYADIIDFMVDTSTLGYSRFSHFENLRQNASYLKIKDFNVFSEKVCRDLLKAFPEESENELIRKRISLEYLLRKFQKEYLIYQTLNTML